MSVKFKKHPLKTVRGVDYTNSILYSATRAPHAGANARLQLLLENSKSKRRSNYIKIILRISPITLRFSHTSLDVQCPSDGHELKFVFFFP